jgi:hypothetical protein
LLSVWCSLARRCQEARPQVADKIKEDAMTKVTIGTVSEGTLRTEDLLEEFAGELHRLDKDNTLLATVEKLWAASHDMEYRERDGWEYCLNCGNCEDELDQLCSEASARISEHADYLVQELTDALNSYCPPFVYFGTHPGDGADFGFWPDMDALHEAMYDTRHIVGEGRIHHLM